MNLPTPNLFTDSFCCFVAESNVAGILEKGFATGQVPSLEEIETQLSSSQKACPEVHVTPPKLNLYDRLMTTFCLGAER